MKITITPIGAQRTEVTAAAGRIANYLMGKQPATPTGPTGGIVAYYETIEGPGWWSGQGSQHRELQDNVDRQDLESLLQGRDHQTGERIVSATGSAGRSALRAGEATKHVDHQPVWGIADLSSRFDVDRDTITEAANDLAEDQFVSDKDGVRWLTESGVNAIATALGITEPEALPLTGDPDDQLSVTQCALITGLSARYLRRALARWHDHHAEGGIEADFAKDATAYLIGHRVGSRWKVGRADLGGFVERRNPPAVRVAFDAVLTPQKSVSLFTMLSAPNVKAQAVQALIAANTAAMGWLEEHASVGRAKGSPIASEGLTTASFMHGTSRNHDPHPHIHNLIINAIQDSNGDGRTLDARALYREGRAASAVATAEMRWQFHQLGVGFEKHRNGTWEIAGVSEEMVTAFSSRRTEIELALAQIIDGTDSTRNEIQKISASTRGAKTVVDPDILLASWIQTADTVGFDLASLTDGLERSSVAKETLTRSEQADLFRFLDEAATGACENESTFNRGDVMAAINRWSPGGDLVVMPSATLTQLTERFLASALAIPVAHTSQVIYRRDGRPVPMTEDRWTTPTMIRRQSVIDTLWADGHNVDQATVPQALVREASDAAGLTGEQGALVAMWTTSGHQFQAAIGRPGTGKTFAMKAATAAWTDAGCTVVGAAIKGTAAQTLCNQTGMEVETVTWWLNRFAMGLTTLDARTVLIVDEASTLSDRDLGELMAMCVTTGTTLRLIGDPVQQQAIGAGGMWEAMLDRHAVWTPELTQQRRLQDPDQVKAAEQLRGGDIDNAFKTLATNGQLVITKDREDVHMLAVRGWLERRTRGEAAPMVDRRNYTRSVLNEIAQQVRHELGELGPPQQVGKKYFAVGDEVTATAPNRTITNSDTGRYVANGSTGIITAITTDVVTMDLNDIGAVTIPTEWCADHLDLGYAITTYGIQGATVDEISSIIAPGQDLAGLYVSLTRGRRNNELLITQHELHELATETPAVDLVKEIVGSINDRHHVPAIIADPELPALTNQPASLRPNRGDDRMTVIQRDRARRQGIAEPDPKVLAAMPPRPIIPWLAKEWDRVVGEIAVFRWTWAPAPAKGDTWTHLLGSTHARSAEQASERQQLIMEMTTTTLKIVSRGISDTIRDQDTIPETSVLLTWPGWLSNHLHTAAETGRLANVDHTEFTEWLTQIADLRAQHGDKSVGFLDPKTAATPPGQQLLANDPTMEQQRRVSRAPRHRALSR